MVRTVAAETELLKALDVRDHGVVMDGSAPTGSELANAISAASLLGLPLRLPAGTYALSQVDIPSGLTIEGAGPATIIKQAAASQSCFRAVGTETVLGSLTQDLAKGATVINTTLGAGLQPGDNIIVCDTASYTGTDAGYKSGEMLRIASVTDSRITLEQPVRGSWATNGAYTVANGARLIKLGVVKNVTLRNMAFEGHAEGARFLLHFKDVENLTLNGVTTIGAQAGFCMIDNCRDVSISRFGLHGLVDNHATGRPGYGFIITQACHNVAISDGVSTMARHAVTTIGGAYGEPRNLRISGVISTDPTSTAAIDTHAAGEGILITGCLIDSSSIGITVRSRNTTVQGNRIFRTRDKGIVVTDTAQDVVIADNTLVECDDYGISIGMGGSHHRNVAVKGNTITDMTGIGRAIIVDPGTHTNIRIIRNDITRCNGVGIFVDASAKDVLIARNDITDASLVGNAPGINVTGTEAVGVFDIVDNNVRKVAGGMNRAVHTTRTTGRMVGNKGFGSFLSSGTEFNAGTGFVKADNALYA